MLFLLLGLLNDFLYLWLCLGLEALFDFGWSDNCFALHLGASSYWTGVGLALLVHFTVRFVIVCHTFLFCLAFYIIDDLLYLLFDHLLFELGLFNFWNLLARSSVLRLWLSEFRLHIGLAQLNVDCFRLLVILLILFHHLFGHSWSTHGLNLVYYVIDFDLLLRLGNLGLIFILWTFVLTGTL